MMRPNRGLSLVETIVSFFLITYVILALLNLFPGSLLASRKAELSLQAQSYADRVLESARSTGFSGLNLGKRSEDQIKIDSVTYSSQLEIATVAGQDPRFIKSLKVRVWWNVAGRPQEILREVWISNVRS